MTYSETIDYLFQLRLHGMKLGLDKMRALLREMGDPQRKLQFIHIAGTNGKGSVAAMLSSVLRAAGHRTALYTSPHLVSFCERFQINGEFISEADVVRLVENIRPCMDRVAAQPDLRCPTFFEVVTAMAAKYFAEQNVDVVVWETGLGGRLDATNVVTPLVSVITEIGFDHTQYLGETIEAITREKAGIIKPGVPVVLSANEPRVVSQVVSVAAELKSPLVQASTVSLQRRSDSLEGQSFRVVSATADYGIVQIPLVGEHQLRNCATAIATIDTLRQRGISLGTEAVRRGLAQTRWPGRFQVVVGTPPVVLDGAHNPHAIEALGAALKKYCGDRPLTLVLGILKDKDYTAICQTLAPLAREIFAVPVKSDRLLHPETLAELCRAANPSATVRIFSSVGEALNLARQNREATVVVTGSLFLIGEAMHWLGLEPRFSSVTAKEMALQ